MRDWLIARPIAHRGLHDASAGVIENTASAFRAAIAGRYGIECDLQISADGEAMVHHDDRLGRLNEGSDRLDGMTAAALKRVPFKATADRMLTLGELCDLVAARETLLLELKGRFDGDQRLARRVGAVLANYPGPVAVMSFDPGEVAAMRSVSSGLWYGLTAQRRQPGASGAGALRYVLKALAARPRFLAYRVQDLSSPLPQFARHVLRMPLLTWTVRTPDERVRAAQFADQVIFEGYRP
jgi:glycerophosphoryl diester phosphodiesterase